MSLLAFQIFVILVVLFFVARYKAPAPNLRLPPGPPAWPVLGHLLEMAGVGHPWRKVSPAELRALLSADGGLGLSIPSVERLEEVRRWPALLEHAWSTGHGGNVSEIPAVHHRAGRSQT